LAYRPCDEACVSLPQLTLLPPPWSVEETNACFIVRDANGQALAYVYFEGEPGLARCGASAHPRRGPAIAANIAKLPELTRKP
jgi:hypothetical protein